MQIPRKCVGIRPAVSENTHRGMNFEAKCHSLFDGGEVDTWLEK